MTKEKLKMEKIKAQLSLLTGDFCNKQVNQEYADLCERLINKMARKRAVPFLSGKVEIWAAAIVHAIGSINFLFDKKTKPYVTHDAICEFFDVSKSTVQQKSKLIRGLFKMQYWDSEFSTQAMAKQNPYANLARISGFLVSLDM